MDRILFGDNQFFGVNHMSEEKARQQAMRFQDLQAIIDVLDIAYDEGIRTFMCTTQDRMVDVCEHFRQHKERYAGFKFYPCMPYAHKYANAVTEYGILGALQRFLPSNNKIAAIWKGGLSVAKRDIEGIAELLIDSEMNMFRGLETPVIFLQNVVTDLLLGLGYKEGFRIFADHVKRKYNAEAGFITMNLPRLLDVLDELGHRQSDRMFKYQQDRFPHVRRYRALREDDRDETVPTNRHVGTRVRRIAPARSH